MFLTYFVNLSFTDDMVLLSFTKCNSIYPFCSYIFILTLSIKIPDQIYLPIQSKKTSAKM